MSEKGSRPAGGPPTPSASGSTGPFRIPSEKDRIVRLFENLPRTPVLKRPESRTGTAVRKPPPALKPVIPLDRDTSLEKCGQATDPHEIVAALLGYGIGIARRALLFYPKGHRMKGIDGAGDGIIRAAVPDMELDLDKPSVFRNFAYGTALYLGPMPRTEANDAFVKMVGSQRPAGALIVPVLAGDRAANLFYLDNGHAKDIEADLADLLILTTAAGKAYQRIIQQRRAPGAKREG